MPLCNTCDGWVTMWALLSVSVGSFVDHAVVYLVYDDGTASTLIEHFDAYFPSIPVIDVVVCWLAVYMPPNSVRLANDLASVEPSSSWYEPVSSSGHVDRVDHDVEAKTTGSGVVTVEPTDIASVVVSLVGECETVASCEWVA